MITREQAEKLADEQVKRYKEMNTGINITCVIDSVSVSECKLSEEMDALDKLVSKMYSVKYRNEVWKVKIQYSYSYNAEHAFMSYGRPVNHLHTFFIVEALPGPYVL